jgi:hypothetical protein
MRPVPGLVNSDPPHIALVFGAIARCGQMWKYPFDTATFGSAMTKQLSKTAVGLNAGVDISRLLTPHFGVRALVRYSRGDVKFDDPDVGKQTVQAGGVEVVGGVRVGF